MIIQLEVECENKYYKKTHPIVLLQEDSLLAALFDQQHGGNSLIHSATVCSLLGEFFPH